MGIKLIGRKRHTDLMALTDIAYIGLAPVANVLCRHT